MTSFALIDGNNFYVSCERVFLPKLLGKPVIVLSNNDGNVISRSNEAKQLGIKMGVPYFKIKNFCKQQQIHVFSSNYALYGDMSKRVVALIKKYEPLVETYSIDEVFVQLQGIEHIDLNKYLNTLRENIFRSTGIPVSIGIGRTKTLAKLASFQAKKRLKQPICILEKHINEADALQTTPVEEIWGIGRQWALKLQALNIMTAKDLSLISANVIRHQYNSVLADTVRELQGQSCLKLETLADVKKNIMSSKSFGNPIREYQSIAEALSQYAARAAEKLRAQYSLATTVTVFLETNRFKTNSSYYHRSKQFALPFATNDTGIIIKTAKECLREIYKADLQYHKTGILLGSLIPDHTPHQLELFQTAFEEKQHQQKSISSAAKMMDEINQRFGKDTLFIASQKTHAPETWHLRANFKSPCYTTKWSDIIQTLLSSNQLVGN